MINFVSRFALIIAIGGWINTSIAAPITDTVFVNSTEWAQVDLFTNLSWDQMNAVCPGGICSGELKGYDMTGWLWADTAAITDLFNHYIGSPALGISNGSIQSSTNFFGVPFFADGWRSVANTKITGVLGASAVGRKSDSGSSLASVLSG